MIKNLDTGEVFDLRNDKTTDSIIKNPTLINFTIDDLWKDYWQNFKQT